jgi:hypothetical protein
MRAIATRFANAPTSSTDERATNFSSLVTVVRSPCVVATSAFVNAMRRSLHRQPIAQPDQDASGLQWRSYH